MPAQTDPRPDVGRASSSFVVAALEVLTVEAPQWRATVGEVAAAADVEVATVLGFEDIEPLRGVLLAAVAAALDVEVDEAIEVVEAVRDTPVPPDGSATVPDVGLDPDLDLAARAAAVSDAGPDVVYLEWFVARQLAEESGS